MFKIGYAQEIITPPTGVGLAGYFNKRPNQGMYDDLYVKVVMIEAGSRKFGFMTFDLCNVAPKLFEELEAAIVKKYGRKLHDSLIISATHTHTGSEFRNRDGKELDERTLYAFIRARSRARRAASRVWLNA